MIDLRSDTVTQPTDEMRRAMAEAEVGDDVLGEDPTVNALEQLAARKMGKESALFVPSGTMGNLASVLTHCRRGDEVLLGDRCHIFLNEAGGLSALGGAHPRTLANADDGTLPLHLLERSIRRQDIHFPVTRLICLENTHNYCSGSPLTVEYMESVAELARAHNLKIHLDGARIFNAALALGVAAAELARRADSVMFCLSKGLSAPAGSLICGTKDFIAQARRTRKMLGGGMRQAGHLAAAGIVALDGLVDRLREDHANAQTLARGLARLPGIRLDPDRIKTNIVFFDLEHPNIAPERFLREMESRKIRILLVGGKTFRAVLNRNVDAQDTLTALDACRDILGG